MIYGMAKLQGTHPYLWAAMGYLGYRSAYDWKVTSGVRDSAQQAALYAQGRTAPGPVVTDAPAGTSAHEYGLAIDAYPTIDGGASIVLDTAHPAFAERDRLLKESEFFSSNLQTDVKISSGVDVPHLQVRDWQTHKNWKATFDFFVIGVSAAVALAYIFHGSK